jgi:hypothetical protein
MEDELQVDRYHLRRFAIWDLCLNQFEANTGHNTNNMNSWPVWRWSIFLEIYLCHGATAASEA